MRFVKLNLLISLLLIHKGRTEDNRATTTSNSGETQEKQTQPSRPPTTTTKSTGSYLESCLYITLIFDRSWFAELPREILVQRQAVGIPDGNEIDTTEFDDYTETSEGCHCWWDRSHQSIDPDTNEAYSCACCKNGGRQCGYPMHMYCHLQNSTLPTGCNGWLSIKILHKLLAILSLLKA